MTTTQKHMTSSEFQIVSEANAHLSGIVLTFAKQTSELSSDVKVLKKAVAECATKSDLEAFKVEMRGEFEEFKEEMRSEFEEFKEQIIESMNSQFELIQESITNLASIVVEKQSTRPLKTS